MPEVPSSTRRAEDHCEVCGTRIRTMIFRGTHLCSDLCRKVKSGELTREAADAQRTSES